MAKCAILIFRDLKKILLEVFPKSFHDKCQHFLKRPQHPINWKFYLLSLLMLSPKDQQTKYHFVRMLLVLVGLSPLVSVHQEPRQSYNRQVYTLAQAGLCRWLAQLHAGFLFWGLSLEQTISFLGNHYTSEIDIRSYWFSERVWLPSHEPTSWILTWSPVSFLALSHPKAWKNQEDLLYWQIYRGQPSCCFISPFF